MMGGDVKKKKNRRCFGEQMHTRAASNSERIPDKKKKRQKMKERPANSAV